MGEEGGTGGTIVLSNLDQVDQLDTVELLDLKKTQGFSTRNQSPQLNCNPSQKGILLKFDIAVRAPSVNQFPSLKSSLLWIGWAQLVLDRHNEKKTVHQ